MNLSNVLQSARAGEFMSQIMPHTQVNNALLGTREQGGVAIAEASGTIIASDEKPVTKAAGLVPGTHLTQFQGGITALKALESSEHTEFLSGDQNQFRLKLRTLRTHQEQPMIAIEVKDLEEERIKRERLLNHLRLISHEVMTPIVTICSVHAALKEDPPLPLETQHELLEIVDGQSEYLRLFLQDWFRLEQLTLKAAGSEEPIPLTPIMAETVETLQAMQNTTLPQLRLVTPTQPASVRVDAYLLERIIYNLVAHALQGLQPDDCLVISQELTPDTVRVTLKHPLTTRSQAICETLRHQLPSAQHRKRIGTNLTMGFILASASAERLGWTLSVTTKALELVIPRETASTAHTLVGAEPVS